MTDKQKSVHDDVMETCWQLARQSQTAEALDPVARAEAVATLRRLADTLEKNPEKVLSLMVMGSVYTEDDVLDIRRVQIASDPCMAAWFLATCDDGKEALASVRPYLLGIKLNSMLTKLMNEKEGDADADKG